ncbi:MAG: rhomboid family intramembrane serine protease, partial [Rhodothermales bacterium]|nr:rhomboid family intramembrane serine protease [Rhodothermales bacterium]
MNETYYRAPTHFSVFPPVVKNLLILNGLFYLAQLAVEMTYSDVLARFLNALALYPLGSPDAGYSIFGPGVVDIPGFWPWQLVTYAFLHGGFGHIFFNLFLLWMFGLRIENDWGSKRFAIFYFACVIGAGLIQMFAMYGTGIPTVGASGGVFGILLAFGMMYPDEPIYIYFLFPVKAKWLVIGLGVFSIFAGLTGAQAGIAHYAHLGGMIFGFLLIQFWRGKLPVQP